MGAWPPGIADDELVMLLVSCSYCCCSVSCWLRKFAPAEVGGCHVIVALLEDFGDKLSVCVARCCWSALGMDAEGAWKLSGVSMLMVNVRGGGLDGKVAATRHYD